MNLLKPDEVRLRKTSSGGGCAVADIQGTRQDMVQAEIRL